ncbi:MAG: hypothetical protein ACPF99_06960 [Flavobacteriaceae bacterium]
MRPALWGLYQPDRGHSGGAQLARALDWQSRGRANFTAVFNSFSTI